MSLVCITKPVVAGSMKKLLVQKNYNDGGAGKYIGGAGNVFVDITRTCVKLQRFYLAALALECNAMVQKDAARVESHT